MCQYLVIFQKMYEKFPNFMVVFLFYPLYCRIFFPRQYNVTDRPTSDQWMDRLGYVRNPRSLMEGTETLCRDDIGDLPGSPEHL